MCTKSSVKTSNKHPKGRYHDHVCWYIEIVKHYVRYGKNECEMVSVCILIICFVLYELGRIYYECESMVCLFVTDLYFFL